MMQNENAKHFSFEGIMTLSDRNMRSGAGRQRHLCSKSYSLFYFHGSCDYTCKKMHLWVLLLRHDWVKNIQTNTHKHNPTSGGLQLVSHTCELHVIGVFNTCMRLAFAAYLSSLSKQIYWPQKILEK